MLKNNLNNTTHYKSGKNSNQKALKVCSRQYLSTFMQIF